VLWELSQGRRNALRMEGVSEGARADDHDFALYKAVAEAAKGEDVRKLRRLVLCERLDIRDLFDDGVLNVILVIRGQEAERGFLEHDIAMILDDCHVRFFHVANGEFPVRQGSLCFHLRRITVDGRLKIEIILSTSS